MYRYSGSLLDESLSKSYNLHLNHTLPNSWKWRISGVKEGSTSSETTPELLATVPLNDVPVGSKITFYEDALCLAKTVSSVIFSEKFSQYFSYKNDGSDDGVKYYYGKVKLSNDDEGPCKLLTYYVLKTKEGHGIEKSKPTSIGVVSLNY